MTTEHERTDLRKIVGRKIVRLWLEGPYLYIELSNGGEILCLNPDTLYDRHGMYFDTSQVDWK